MTQIYTNPQRAKGVYSLPDAEVFHMSAKEIKAAGKDSCWYDGDGEPLAPGWYWWACFPGCLPDSDPFGPFDTQQDAIDDAQDNEPEDDEEDED